MINSTIKLSGSQSSISNQTVVGFVSNVGIRGLGSKSRINHGIKSSLILDFNAVQTHHLLSSAGSHAWTFSGFTQSTPEIKIMLTITGGAPTISLPIGCSVAADSMETLSSMTNGKYLVEAISFDDGMSIFIFVSKLA